MKKGERGNVTPKAERANDECVCVGGTKMRRGTRPRRKDRDGATRARERKRDAIREKYEFRIALSNLSPSGSARSCSVPVPASIGREVFCSPLSILKQSLSLCRRSSRRSPRGSPESLQHRRRRRHHVQRVPRQTLQAVEQREL